MQLRPSQDGDIDAIARIYADCVRRGTASFELDPPSADEMAERRRSVLSSGLPYLVAADGDRVLGYAYASAFRPRPAYRFSLEDSIYLDEAARGRGVGTLLLAELIARCEARGARQMVAVIGDSAQAASIALHRAAGFAHIGTIADCGWKFGRWLDVVMMQRSLGAGAATPPT